MEIAIGIDIGGTNTVFGIVNKAGTVIDEDSLSTRGHKDVYTYIEKLTNAIHALLNKNNNSFILSGIGIGAPNANYYRGSIEEAPNLEWKGTIPFADLMHQKFHVPVKLTNDANAAALGEMLYGGAKNMKDFLFITLGTGVGSGIVANGKLVYGHDGFAGELGHIIVIPDGRKCGCNRYGCLETYASATGIKRTALELLNQSSEESLLRNYSETNLDARIIYESAKKGDNTALKCFEITVDILGKALANAVAFTSPEAIFIFGGLARAHDLLLNPLKEKMEANLLNIYKNKVKILPSQLDGSKAAILGASALVWAEIN